MGGVYRRYHRDIRHDGRGMLLPSRADIEGTRYGETSRGWTIDLQTALDVEKRFAVKADIDRLEMRINESIRSMLREHENNVNARYMDNRIAQVLRALGR